MLTFPTTQRSSLQITPEFRELFQAAKQRVREMSVRLVEISDPIEQTLFEVYVALALNTHYNDFGTH
jgi:hypothetical protein